MMKIRIATLISSLVLVQAVCFADSAPTTQNASTVTLSHILQTVQDNGFMSIKEVTLENNVYKIQAFDFGGQEFTFEVNAQTGEFLNKSNDENGITTQQAVLAVEKAGYKTIESITADNNSYSIYALNSNGEGVELDVSRQNGVVSED